VPGFLLHVGAVSQCFHQAPATIAPNQRSVLVSGQPAVTLGAAITVAGCPFQVPVPPGTKPQPCVRIQWGTVATKVLIGGRPALLAPTPGVVPGTCLSIEQIPQGAPTVAQVQTRVSGL
jgi:hypothetical protein